jgi:hypothetical protein
MNRPLTYSRHEYKCQFHSEEHARIIFHTAIIEFDNRTLKCLPPVFNSMTQGKQETILVRIY